MTPDEIQALRETHHSDGHVLVERCFGCGDDWPCDIGELLNAYELVKNRNLRAAKMLEAIKPEGTYVARTIISLLRGEADEWLSQL